MSALLRCHDCGWSRRYRRPEVARRAAGEHRCSAGTRQTAPYRHGRQDAATAVQATTPPDTAARDQAHDSPRPDASPSATRLPAPAYIDDQVTLYTGDALDILTGLPADYADCVVTSPPYWGLRDYGTGRWVGGNPVCAHRAGARNNIAQAGHTAVGYPPGGHRGEDRDHRCRRCGAHREDRQHGLESTAGQYIDRLRAVFAQLRRVLTPAGTVWLNLGDSYSARSPGATADPMRSSALTGRRSVAVLRDSVRNTAVHRAGGLGRKNLLGMPWRVALALQADGWILRNAVVWHKPNAMPESVGDRLSNRYELLFLLVRQPRYFFDLDPIRQPLARPEARGEGILIGGLGKGSHAWRGSTARRRGRTTYGKYNDTRPFTAKPGAALRPTGRRHTAGHPDGKNPGDVWTLPTRPLPQAHFAAFPVDIPLRCIAAGCPAGGLVLDPFSGAGTTGLAAVQLGRRYTGIDLNPAFHDIARRRLHRLPNPHPDQDQDTA